MLAWSWIWETLKWMIGINNQSSDLRHITFRDAIGPVLCEKRGETLSLLPALFESEGRTMLVSGGPRFSAV